VGPDRDWFGADHLHRDLGRNGPGLDDVLSRNAPTISLPRFAVRSTILPNALLFFSRSSLDLEPPSFPDNFFHNLCVVETGEFEEDGVGGGGGEEEPVEELEENVLSLANLGRRGRGERSTGTSGSCGASPINAATGGDCGDGDRELAAPPSSLSASASKSEVSSPEISSSVKNTGASLSSDKMLSLVEAGSRAGESPRDVRPGDPAAMKDVTVEEKSQESIEALDWIEGCFRRS